MAVIYQSALFAQFFEHFSQNVFPVTPVKKYYQIARFVLEVSFYQKNIGFFHQSVAHLEITPQDADFTIAVVSENDTHITPPNAFWGKDDLGLDGILCSEDGRYFALYNGQYGFFQLADNKLKKAFFWMQHEVKLPEWERSFSFRNILHHFTENTNYCMLHAAGLGTSEGGAILPGKGGSGKSNTSLACVGSSIHYLGDDFLLVDVDNLVAYSLFNVAKIEMHRVPFFPQLQSILIKEDIIASGKIPFFLYPKLSNSLINSFKIKCIVLPQFSGLLNTSLSKTTDANSLKAMAPSTLGLLNASQVTFKKMATIAKKLPSYVIHTGTDLNDIPTVLERLLNNLKSKNFVEIIL